MRCPTCQRENASDASFCAGCGGGLTAETAGAAATLAGGRYQLGSLLGEGGSKRVFLGRDRRLDRAVAIATIETAALDEAGRLRVEREAQAMARLGDHPNIVAVYDVVEEGGAVFIVSQYMAGGDLARRIAAAPGRRLAIDEVLAMGVQICRALEHAHARGVVHRDLKPANVWLGSDGTAKLGDFGLALALDRTRLSAEGRIVGTAAYIPPEQALGRTLDTRSDLYALGAILYEMLTGRPPFTADDAVAVLSQHLHTPPVAPRWLNPAIPPPLERLVLDLLAKDPEARPASAAAVRGRLQALHSAPLGSPPPSAAAAPANPLDRLAAGVFVGRSDETARLRASFEEALSGRSRIVLLSGEPGIGKTRLAEELTTYARMRGAEVLWGRCHDGPGAPPFWPWVQVVRGWLRGREQRELLADLGSGASDLATVVSEIHEALPGLAAPPRLDPEQARFRLFESAAVLLRNAAQRRPLVLVLDDLHWADEASLHLLQFLAREVGSARLLLLGTYRDVELRRGHPLSQTLGELQRERATERIVLRGLSANDVERFLGETAGAPPARALAETVHRETEGNPFFVQEIVRLLAADGQLARGGDEPSWGHVVPQGVEDVIGRRLDKLSPAANEVLAVAAVLGREFDLRLLGRVGERPEIALLEALDEATAARVLAEVRESPGRYRFSHALVRETLYAELGAPQRVRLHRAAGEALARSAGEEPGPLLAEIAHHFFQSVEAGDAERALDACARAAEWARSRQSWEDAALHLERAVQVLEMAERPDPRRLCDLLVALAELQSLGRDLERTRATAQRAADLAAQVGLSAHVARAALAYGANLPVVEVGRVDATMVELLERALAALGSGEPALRAQVLLRLAQELGFSSDRERQASLLEQARRLAEEVGDPALEARVGLGHVFGIWAGPHDGLMAEAERLIEIARRGDDPAAEQSAWNVFATGALWVGEMTSARRAQGELERLAGVLRTPFGRYQPLRLAIAVAILEGRFEPASALIQEARQVAGSAVGGTNLVQWAGVARYLMSRQRGSAMRPDQTLALIERFLGYNSYRAILCGVYLSVGARNDALRELGILAVDDFRRVERDSSWVAVLAMAADHAWELDQPRYAQALLDLLLPYAGRCPGIGPMIVCLGPIDLRLGRMNLLLGRYAAAERHLREAIGLATRMGARPYLAESRHALAVLYRRRGGEGDQEAALRQIDATLEVARGVGMDRLLADAAALRAELTGEPGGDGDRTLPAEGSSPLEAKSS